MSENTGYKVAFLFENEVKIVIGFRISEWLHTGIYLEVEELITKKEERSMRYGSKLFDWSVAFERQNGCKQLRFVSGVSRDGAHKFYLNKGMSFEAKYFFINVLKDITNKSSRMFRTAWFTSGLALTLTTAPYPGFYFYKRVLC